MFCRVVTRLLIVWCLFVTVICNRYTINLKAILNSHGGVLRSIFLLSKLFLAFLYPAKMDNFELNIQESEESVISLTMPYEGM